MNKQFLLKTDEVHIEIIEEPKLIDSIYDLPDWRITLWDYKENVAKFVWLKINRRVWTGKVQWKLATANAFSAFMKEMMQDPEFIRMYGNLTYLPIDRQGNNPLAPEMSIVVELNGYLTRRGKNFESKIMAGFGKKLMPRLSLGLGRDVFLTTDIKGTRSYPMQRKVSIMGTVKIRDGEQVAFEMYHSFLDLRSRATAATLTTAIEVDIEKSFPFAKGVFYDWEFLNLQENLKTR